MLIVFEGIGTLILADGCKGKKHQERTRKQ